MERCLSGILTVHECHLATDLLYELKLVDLLLL